MIKILDLKTADKNQILNRRLETYGEYEQTVKQIIADVATRGDEALKEYARRFDGVDLIDFEVTAEEFSVAEQSLAADYKQMLVRAANNIKEFHRAQIREGYEIKRGDGIVIGQRVTPIEKAGIYVPGGTASYPSTVLMDAIPAKIAGVDEIIMTTPPQKDGSIKPEILYAAKLAGVDRVFKIGGAGAIAALAYGTQSVPKTDKIVGPGNIFVALAKKQVFGIVGIDMVAGPSEILVIADSGANASWIAADMLSQAEHDKLATAVLVTDSKSLAESVAHEIEKQIEKLPRKHIARASIDNNGKILIAENLAEAVKTSNEIAPEHLELAVGNPFELLGEVKNAGSVFLGNYAPEALGDYYAGPNHTLPTGGSARFSSPLGVEDFVKRSAYSFYNREALKVAGDDIVKFAESEGLTAHAYSVAVRFEEER